MAVQAEIIFLRSDNFVNFTYWMQRPKTSWTC